MEKTPCKSPRLNKFVVVVDSPSISCSRPSGRSNECIVINSSSSYKVQQKDDYGADTKSKGKEKLVKDHYQDDSDFEDEIPLSKRLRVNNDQDLKNVDGGSVSKGGVSVDFEINRETPTLDDFVMPNMRESQLVALETGQTYVSSLVDVESENICVTPLEVAKAGKTKFNQFGVIEGENTFISPVQHVRTKIPGKYAQSPYTNLSESGGTSVNTVKYCLWRHPFVNYKGFDMYSEVILHFKKWVDSKLSKKRGKKTSFFTAASNLIDHPFEFGVGRVDLMDWFHPLAYPGQPWRDLHVDVIMYYLRKFCKYGPDNSARVTTTDPFFISWVVQIHDAWEANDKDESLISIHHEVAQYIRGDRILANTPWVDVDHVCIPVNSSDAFH
uniref:Ulp1 protease family, C-terminal catalytic domain containing protein n=1 Tax=Solanum tuberosum TaxID=4113 RepID=M1AEU9_SOLTU